MKVRTFPIHLPIFDSYGIVKGSYNWKYVHAGYVKWLVICEILSLMVQVHVEDI